MSCRGVHFAITDEDLGILLAAKSDDQIREVISDGIEERWDEDWLVQTDDAWAAIHRCLTDGNLECENGEYPLRICILGGRQLYSGDDYVIVFKGCFAIRRPREGSCRGRRGLASQEVLRYLS